MITCLNCDDTDLSVINYVELEEGQVEVVFECRQCRNVFPVTISKEEFQEYK